MSKSANAVKYVSHCWIPMSDGVRLSASLWLPAVTEKVPAILEIHPYRKGDMFLERDKQMCSYFAEQGIATVRVDMRGHGDSEGLHDAYRTYKDTTEILAWLREQPWCSGALGMMGLSWGGTNSFMAAARKAPGLKAILTNASSHDRYGVGMLWKNGCLLNENFCWVTSITGFSTRPPDPKVLGEQWRELWLKRLEEHEPELRHLFAHQRRDEYWDEHTAYGIEDSPVAVYMTAGLADNNYAQTPPALMSQLKSEAATLLGPWGHKYPNVAMPGPAIDFLSEATNWFSRHLRGDKEIPAPAPLRIFVAEDTPAVSYYEAASGRWVALSKLPDVSGPRRTFHLGGGRLQDHEALPGESLRHKSPLDTGAMSGELMPWFAFGAGPELPGDQRVDDGKSLCFDSEPLEQALEYVGAPELTLEVTVDKPVAMLAVRLCDIKPDGASTRVSVGVFNLNQRPEVGGSDRAPVQLEPGRKYTLKLPLDFAAYRFLPGHRVRLAISTSYWPVVWPSPEQAEIQVNLAGSQLSLPLLQASDELQSPVFDAPPQRPTLRKTVEEPSASRRSVSHDLVTGETETVIELSNGPVHIHETDWKYGAKGRESYRIGSTDASSAQAEISWEWYFSRGEWASRTLITSKLTCDKTKFYARIQLEAFENEEKIFEKKWDSELERDHI
ncbi:MAG: CocE/NonD family hydrolase [Alcaligenaceae bacterium]|nr:CocE/NonD family hydrolase [Alcaligenaceae bacterium]